MKFEGQSVFERDLPFECEALCPAEQRELQISMLQCGNGANCNLKGGIVGCNYPYMNGRQLLVPLTDFLFSPLQTNTRPGATKGINDSYCSKYYMFLFVYQEQTFHSLTTPKVNLSQKAEVFFREVQNQKFLSSDQNPCL